MSAMIIQQGLLGLVRLLTTAVAAGWVGSPMSWSPDARWLSYTVATDPAQAGRRPGWLFEPTSGEAGHTGSEVHPDGRGDGSPSHPDSSGAYRIWASQRDGAASVLIEESAWPLTAPSWGPRGRSLAFGRFVPAPLATRSATTRGRMEIVLQDGLDRKRILMEIPEFELDEEARARFPHVQIAWSPDGQYMAVPRPGRSPSVHIVRIDSRRVLRTLDNSLLPAWSPDGSRVALIHQDGEGDHSLMMVERRGQVFGPPQALVPVGRIIATPGWGADGRSILAVVERQRLRFPDLDLVRVSVETRESLRILSLVPEVVRRMATIRGIAIDFDRNEELCFFSVDLEGRDSDICWSVPREQIPYKRFYPVDQSLHTGSLAIAPDGHAVAIRFGPPESLSPPAVCELQTDRLPPTERTILIVPDESARRAWSTLLARTARSLLAIVMPPIMLDGKPVGRPAWLPLPDEIPAAFPVRSRFAKLGRFGSSLTTGSQRSDSAPGVAEDEADREDRLFFDYLQGDYKTAMADLDGLEDRATTRHRRLALLGLRAQILWAQGEADRAREVAGYLLEASGGEVYRLEETPIGRSLVPEHGTERAWARYLVQRTRQPLPPAPPISEPNPGDRDDPLLANPFAPFGPPGLDLQRLPGDGLPFAPNLQGGQRDEMMRLQLLRLQQQLQLDAQRRAGQAPPPPRPIEGRPN